MIQNIKLDIAEGNSEIKGLEIRISKNEPMRHIFSKLKALKWRLGDPLMDWKKKKEIVSLPRPLKDKSH